jgi:ABC-type branched-subunit amino acid transport system ATPase component
VLHGVNFHVDEGEVVTLLGRNGAGRTSTMRAIMGLIGSRKGLDPHPRAGSHCDADPPHCAARHRLLP